MLHKVSEFIEQVRAMNKLADRLEHVKYHTPKDQYRDAQVNDLIDQIKYLAYLIRNDNQPYEKIKNEDL